METISINDFYKEVFDEKCQLTELFLNEHSNIDIGSVVAFLCSDESKWINAQRIEVAGGVNI